MWDLQQSTNKFGLNYNGTGVGLLYASPSNGVSVSQGTSGYGRMITLTPDTSFEPHTRADLGPRISVTSEVWWNDKKCPVSDAVPTDGRCKIKLETYLTNWKNF